MDDLILPAEQAGAMIGAEAETPPEEVRLYPPAEYPLPNAAALRAKASRARRYSSLCGSMEQAVSISAIASFTQPRRIKSTDLR